VRANKYPQVETTIDAFASVLSCGQDNVRQFAMPEKKRKVCIRGANDLWWWKQEDRAGGREKEKPHGTLVLGYKSNSDAATQRGERQAFCRRCQKITYSFHICVSPFP
jgi:hypothetical protein